jgi:exodeoxyribonuclease VII large subunit
MHNQILKVGEFVAYINQTLEYAYPEVLVEGEVSGFTVNQNKFVFFDIKDDTASVNCFMMIFQLKTPLEDGMKVRVTAVPKVTNKGRFSLTVRQVVPVGEGELLKSFELLRKQLAREGLFAPERKRPLPRFPSNIGLISSKTAAGASDFLTILQQRWGEATVRFAHVTVQGESAPDQIVRAIQYFNEESNPVDVLVLVRGGGSIEDLWAFNTEPVVRAIAGSRAPTIVGVGHEDDVSLADLVADQRAATPTHAAQLVVPDRREIAMQLTGYGQQLQQSIKALVSTVAQDYQNQLQLGLRQVFERALGRFELLDRTLHAYDPTSVLSRGYAIVRREAAAIQSTRQLQKGDRLNILMHDGQIITEVESVQSKNSKT